MMREFAQMIVQLPGKHRLQCLACALVQLFAPLNQQRVVGDLPRQRVLENVLGVTHRRLLVDELAQLQIIEQPVEFFIWSRDHRTNQRQWKFTPDHGESLQQVLRIGRQAIDTRGKNPLHRRRNL